MGAWNFQATVSWINYLNYTNFKHVKVKRNLSELPDTSISNKSILVTKECQEILGFFIYIYIYTYIHTVFVISSTESSKTLIFQKEIEN